MHDAFVFHLFLYLWYKKHIKIFDNCKNYVLYYEIIKKLIWSNFYMFFNWVS
jgi:hypothetical protein